MKTLREQMTLALEEKRALGHFNISDSTQLHAIVRAARSLQLPVIIGMSEGESEFLGLDVAVALVSAMRKEYGVDVYLNADHAHSVEACKAAIDAGFDSVIFDGTKGSYDESIAGTQEVVAYARASGRDVIVEGELGYIGSSSKVLDDVPEDVALDALPSVEDAQRFVEETGVDALAPAVGNLHGMLKGRDNPSLQIPLITSIRQALPETSLVLHGGSGLTEDDFSAGITAGMNVVHINTEIRIAYRDGIATVLIEKPDEIAPYRYLDHGRDAVEKVVHERLSLFNNS